MTNYRISRVSGHWAPAAVVATIVAASACGGESTANTSGGGGSSNTTGQSSGSSTGQNSGTGSNGSTGTGTQTVGTSGGGTTSGGSTTSGTTTGSNGNLSTSGGSVTTGTNGSNGAGATGASTGATAGVTTGTSGGTTGGRRGGGMDAGATNSTGGGRDAGGTTGGSGTTGGTTGGASDAGAGLSAGCGHAPTIAASNYNNGHHIAITAANMQREYILNVPTNYDNTHPYRLIIAYHELNGNDDEMYRNQYYHLLPLSDNSAIFVAPNGQQNGANCTAAGGCGWPNPNNSDLALADALVAQIEQNFCVDTNRIFATGWSYGGSMSYKTACERPLGGTANGFVRAIAVYSGSQLSGNCTPSKPVAYYASHGTHDSVLPYANGVSLAQNFAAANGCTWMTPTMVTSGNHVCTNLTGCTAGHPLEFCSFNGDHTPDPTDPNQRTSWEYQNVWTFLSQF